jgi:hypothetical protein
MGREKCCDKFCLQGRDMKEATAVMLKCLRELEYKNRKERNEYLLRKIKSVCWTGDKSKVGGYYKYNWQIGEGDSKILNVCRQAFMIAYNLKKCGMESLCKHLKEGVSNLDEHVITDKTNLLNRRNCSFLAVKKYAALCGIDLSVEQLAAMQIPNTPAALETYSWMHFYFELVGDAAPNCDNEIHLEPTSILEIYKEYVFHTEAYKMDKNEIYDIRSFGTMWEKCFPNVKIREFKAVGGKCGTCAHLSDVRRKCNDLKRKQEITYLHAMHRSSYMGERLTYTERRQEAKQFPKNYLSMISDGMQQAHCTLPYMGNLDSFGADALPQHLQGVLVHGRGLFMHRTFHTCKNTSNLQMHSILLSLEYILNKENELPPTFYYQIDGGSENTAQLIYVFMEFMIAKRLFQKIVLTRLIVGHTHEDIDAVFGRVWRGIRNKHVLTPQDYVSNLKTCLRRKREDEFLEINDIIVVPNYTKYFNGSHTAFSNYKCTHETQHQFIFEAVRPSHHLPMGCRTTYRAYARDEVVELIKDGSTPTGLTGINTYVKTFPRAEDNESGLAGMCMLQKFPTNKLEPLPFVQGSANNFNDVMHKVNSVWGTKAPSNVADWKAFKNETPIPTSDCVEDYIAANPHQFHIPLLDELFNKMPSEVDLVLASANNEQVNSIDYLIHQLPIAEAQPSIIWEGMKNKPPKAIIKKGILDQRVIKARKFADGGIQDETVIVALKEHCTKPPNKPSTKPRKQRQPKNKLDGSDEVTANKKPRASKPKVNNDKKINNNQNNNNNTDSSKLRIIKNNKNAKSTQKYSDESSYHSDSKDENYIKKNSKIKIKKNKNIKSTQKYNDDNSSSNHSDSENNNSEVMFFIFNLLI